MKNQWVVNNKDKRAIQWIVRLFVVFAMVMTLGMTVNADEENTEGDTERKGNNYTYTVPGNGTNKEGPSYTVLKVDNIMKCEVEVAVFAYHGDNWHDSEFMVLGENDTVTFDKFYEANAWNHLLVFAKPKEGATASSGNVITNYLTTGDNNVDPVDRVADDENYIPLLWSEKNDPSAYPGLREICAQAKELGYIAVSGYRRSGTNTLDNQKGKYGTIPVSMNVTVECLPENNKNLTDKINLTVRIETDYKNTSKNEITAELNEDSEVTYLTINDDKYNIENIREVGTGVWEGQVTYKATLDDLLEKNKSIDFTVNAGIGYGIEFRTGIRSTAEVNSSATAQGIAFKVWTEDETVTYDGKEHGTVKGTEFSLGGKEFKIEGVTTTPKSDVGTYNLKIDTSEAKVFVKEDGEWKETPSGLFAVVKEEGKLTINKRKVTLTSASDIKIYEEGVPLTNHKVTESGDGFVEGEGATYKVTGEQTDIGSSDNKFTYSLNKNTKADNYIITTKEGTLEVKAQDSKVYDMTIKSKSTSTTYNGTTQEISGFEENTLKITIGDTEYEVTELTAKGEGKDRGTYNNVISGTPSINGFEKYKDDNIFKMKNSSGEEVYIKLKYETGTLAIKPRSVEITSGSAEKVYDGKDLKAETFTVDGDGFVDQEGVEVSFSGVQKNAGTSENKFTYVAKSGTNLNNYDIKTEFGDLTVNTKKSDYEVTVTAKSDSATYNGEPQEVTGLKSNVVIIDGKEYTVEGLSASGKGTDAGEYAVAVTGTPKIDGVEANKDGVILLVIKEEGAEKPNIEKKVVVKTVNGTLNIKPRKVKMTSASAKKEYDGEALKAEKVTVSGDGFVGDDGATYEFTGEQTKPGSSKNTFTYQLTENTKQTNYEIELVYGELTVSSKSDEDPDQPSEPEKPSDPEEPEDPKDPETPSEPDQPSEPETPSEPESPSEPETPSAPTNTNNTNLDNSKKTEEVKDDLKTPVEEVEPIETTDETVETDGSGVLGDQTALVEPDDPSAVEDASRLRAQAEQQNRASVQTGDQSHTLLWLICSLVSTFLLIGFVINCRKQKYE